MHNFAMVFGLGMMIVFSLCIVVAFFSCCMGYISGIQLLLIVVCSLAGGGLATELWDYGYDIRQD